MGTSAGVKPAAGAFQAQLERAQIKAYVFGLFPVVSIFGIFAALPQLAHMQTLSLITVGLIMQAMSFSVWLLRCADETVLQRYAVWNDVWHHVCRSACHLLWITFDNDDTFTKILFLFVAPLDAARMSRRKSFKVYIASHVLMTLYRFSNDLVNGAPFIVAVIASSQMLLEISALKHQAEETSLQLNSTLESMSTLARDVMKEAFNCFCDASAVLSSDCSLLEPSPSLSSLLGRGAAAGKAFQDFIHMGARAEYQEFIEQLLQASSKSESEEAPARGTSTTSDTMKMRSIRLHMEDSYAVAVDTNVFHACFQDTAGNPLYLVGVSEAWKPKSAGATGKRSASARMSKRHLSSLSSTLGPGGQHLDLDAGRPQPASSLYAAEDRHLLKMPAADHQMVAGEAAGDMRQRRRGDSPRPSSARGKASPESAARGRAGLERSGVAPQARCAEQREEAPGAAL